MKTGSPELLRLLMSGACALLASACSLTQPAGEASAGPAGSSKKTAADAKKAAKTPAHEPVDEHDDYAELAVSDPLEKVNRGTFWFNDKLYLVLFRPVAKGYELALPEEFRRGIGNAFENVKFPVRFVNSALQGKFKRAGKETGKFVVNTVAGVGGLVKVSDKISTLANVPDEDTGQTFGTWGIGHGPYIVLPVLGPSSLRDGVGLIGDYALNPVNWGFAYHGGHDWEHDWTMIPPTVNTIRLLPDQISKYDAATKEAVDPYISVRSVYIQNRADAVKK